VVKKLDIHGLTPGDLLRCIRGDYLQNPG